MLPQGGGSADSPLIGQERVCGRNAGRETMRPRNLQRGAVRMRDKTLLNGVCRPMLQGFSIAEIAGQRKRRRGKKKGEPP